MFRTNIRIKTWTACVLALVVVCAMLALLGMTLLGGQTDTRAALATPTVSFVSRPTNTLPPPSATRVPPTSTHSAPSATSTVAPTATNQLPTATSAPANTPPPAPTKPPVVKVRPTANPCPKGVLPDGVCYGDHRPNIPDRIVRIASPNIKLDTGAYEVYAPNGVWEVADYAAGHLYSSMNPGEGGNVVLAGHNNWRGEVFRYLEFLQPGNEIDVWTLNGKEYKYIVQVVEKLKEAGAPLAQRLQNGKVMDPTPFEQLTLITCWPYTTYTHRLVVIAKPAQ